MGGSMMSGSVLSEMVTSIVRSFIHVQEGRFLDLNVG